MISLLFRSGLQISARAFGVSRFFGLLGLVTLLAACGGGGGGSSSGGGGSTTPPSVTLSSISVGPASATVAVGLTVQLTATGTYSDGTTKDLSSTVTWTSSDAGKATVSTAGLVTAVAAGATTITAATSGVSGTDAVTVTPPSLVSIAISADKPSVPAGLTVQLTATGTYSDSTTKDLSSSVTWSSAGAAQVMISNSGLVTTGKTQGTVTVTGALSGVSGSDGLTVAPPNLLTIVISPNGPSVAAHKVLQFAAIGSYTDGSTQDFSANVAWTSSLPAVATIIPGSGVATAQTLGNTNIGATMAGGPAISSVQMTVTATIYAYATNFDGDSVSQYQLGSDGSLNALGTVPAGHQPFSISVEPTGEYVYVSNWGSSSISQYKIASNGSLTAIGTGTVASGADPNDVTINHADSFAYVANLGDNTVSQYKIGLDGQLMPMAAPTVASGTAPAALIVDPTDHFAYAANFGANDQNPPPGPGTLSQYSIGSDGSLTPLAAATVASGSGPNALTIDPTSKFLYVANAGDGTVGQYIIGSDGSLTAISPATVATGASATSRPVGIAIDPTGHYVYVANQADGTISQFTVSPTTGALTPISTVSVTGAGVSHVTIDPTGQYLYATNRGEATVSQFAIGPGGALAPMTIPTVASGLHPTAIATGY